VRSVTAFTKNPAAELHAQPIAGAALVFVVLLAVVYARRRALPDQEGLIAFAIAAAAVAGVAKIANTPIVTYAALAALAWTVYQDPDAITRQVRMLKARIGAR
jgi:hypothetical protein